MNNKWIWACYILGAFLTLAWKLCRYIYAGKKAGKPVKDSICEWFFESSTDNTVSWVATIGVVWVLGSVYVNQTDLFGFSLPLPLDYGIAFFLGGVMELVAPSITKWLTQKVIALIESKTKG